LEFGKPRTGSLRSPLRIKPAYSGARGKLGVTPLASVEMSLKRLQIAQSRGAVPDPRDELFRESASDRVRRWLLGTAYACHPKRIGDLPHLLAHSAADIARGGTRVPDQGATHSRPDTFAGICRDISPATIMAAARLGFFPWAHFGPLKWWTRKNRMVLFLDEQHMPKRLRRDMKKSAYRVTFDQAFDEVVKACAGRRPGRPAGLTWVTPRIMRLYSDLHAEGHAHSFEVWSEDGRLVGGGYGIAVGRIFVTESQFSRESNTSKMGFAALNHHLAKWGFLLNDGKQHTPTIEAMGFREIPRAEFEALLAEHADAVVKQGPWKVEADLAVIAA
jgi:leucyl/phenylalanyl-tRNA--protein transferase